MKISFPFNGILNGAEDPDTKTFVNINATFYEEEKRRADQLDVPRAKKGTEEFARILKEYQNVKWTYTVYRELYITPEIHIEEIPHSIAAANMPVFCAGLARYKEGTVFVNNWTGHYRVEPNRTASDIIEAWADSGFVVHVDYLRIVY